MKTKIPFWVIIVFVAKSVTAQIPQWDCNSKEYANFLKSTTYVVFTGKAEFDTALKSAVQKYWKLTPVEFTDSSHAAKMSEEKVTKTSPQRSYLFADTVVSVGILRVLTRSRLEIYMGRIKDHEDDYAIHCYIPFAFYGDEYRLVWAAYRLDYMVKALNDGLDMVKTKNMTGGVDRLKRKMMNEINKKTIAEISTKTLLINKEARGGDEKYKGHVSTEEEVFTKAQYPYKYKFVSDQEFKQIARSNNPDYLLFFPAPGGDMLRHFFVFDVATKETVYYNFSSSAFGSFLTSKGDIKDLMNAGK